MNDQEKNELWRWAVYNRSFELRQTIAEIRSTFIALVGANAIADRVNLIERQLRVIDLEVDNLRKFLGDFDFNPIPIPLNRAATNKNITAFIRELMGEGQDEIFQRIWTEYERLLSIYIGADDEKKFKLASSAYLSYKKLLDIYIKAEQLRPNPEVDKNK